MGLGIGSKTNVVHRIAFLSVAMGAAWLGCAEETRVASPPSQVPIQTTTTGTGGSASDAGPGPELCGCAVVLDEMECRECSLVAVATTGFCASSEGACKADATCVGDSECIGACIHPDAGDEVACVSKCIATATTKYLNYLRCICTHCQTCSSNATCAAP